MKFAKILFAFLFCMVTAAASAGEVEIVHAGTLLAIPGEAPKDQQSIVIRDGVIEAVVDGYIDGSGFGDEDTVAIVDLSNMFVLPGLIDMHVHITGELGPKARTEGFFMEDSELALRASMFARRTLDAGFTTIRDAGGDPAILTGLKASIDKGYVVGPRLIWAGWIGITGGHGDASGYRDDVSQLLRSDTRCDGADECRKATREAIRKGAMWIKIATTGGVLTDTDTGTGKQMTDAEIKEIIETAHSMGRKVAAHAHGTAGINAALRLGVNTIEHGTMLNDESIKLFKQTGAYYVPTILAGQTVMEMAENTDILPPKIAAKALAVGPMIKDAVRRAHKAGVKIAFGTDSAVSPHGQNAREFELLVEAGLTPEEAIITATVNAADALDLSDTIGTIEAGKAADIIAVDGNPLENISELRDVDFVMKGGAVVKN